jgi:hypothetical protein
MSREMAALRSTNFTPPVAFPPGSFAVQSSRTSICEPAPENRGRKPRSRFEFQLRGF